MSSARDVLIRILTKGDSSGAKDVSKSLDKLADNADRVGKKLSLGVTAPLVGLGAVSVKFAADAAESADKLRAVFGPATDEINEKIGDLRDTIPATTAELQDLFSGIQDLLVPLGMAPAEAAEMSESIVTLAGDLASFNNIPVGEALAKIRSGLVGQYEPLLSFGVALNASTVKAKAFEQGIGDGKRELTAAERAQVSYQLILEGTTAAHGNAADTAGSAANQFNFLGKESKELATEIGTRLLPIVTSMVSGLRDALDAASDLPDPIVNVGIAIAAMAAAAGPGLIVTGSLIKNFRLLQSVAPATAAVIAKSGAIAAAGMAGFALGTLIDDWTGFSDEVAATFEAFDGHNEGLAGGLERNRQAMADQVGEIQNLADKERVRNSLIRERGLYVEQYQVALLEGEKDIAEQFEKQVSNYDGFLRALDGIIEKNQQRAELEREAAAAAAEQTPEAIAKAAAEKLSTKELEKQKALREALIYDLDLEEDILRAKISGNAEELQQLQDKKRELVLIKQLEKVGVDGDDAIERARLLVVLQNAAADAEQKRAEAKRKALQLDKESLRTAQEADEQRIKELKLEQQKLAAVGDTDGAAQQGRQIELAERMLKIERETTATRRESFFLAQAQLRKEQGLPEMTQGFVNAAHAQFNREDAANGGAMGTPSAPQATAPAQTTAAQANTPAIDTSSVNALGQALAARDAQWIAAIGALTETVNNSAAQIAELGN